MYYTGTFWWSAYAHFCIVEVHGVWGLPPSLGSGLPQNLGPIGAAIFWNRQTNMRNGRHIPLGLPIFNPQTRPNKIGCWKRIQTEFIYTAVKYWNKPLDPILYKERGKAMYAENIFPSLPRKLNLSSGTDNSLRNSLSSLKMRWKNHINRHSLSEH